MSETIITASLTLTAELVFDSSCFGVVIGGEAIGTHGNDPIEAIDACRVDSAYVGIVDELRRVTLDSSKIPLSEAIGRLAAIILHVHPKESRFAATTIAEFVDASRWKTKITPVTLDLEHLYFSCSVYPQWRKKLVASAGVIASRNR